MANKDFKALVDLAMQMPGRQAMRPVVEKEILHYDIFAALEKEGLLTNLVFQGGTSLRLCWQSNRFSEDLDFAGGRDFNSGHMTAIKETIEDHIGKRYGLAVHVKEPRKNEDDLKQGLIRVDKWQVSVETAPGNRALPQQRIKLEIANVPAYTQELRPILQNYDFLAGYSSNILVRVETLDEVMADKILAFPASGADIRYRDIWDLAFLTQKKARLNPELVLRKITDYGTPNYEEALSLTIQNLPEIIRSKEFQDQMKRFIDADTLAKTLEQANFLNYLEKTVLGLFEEMAEALSDKPKDPEPTFRM